MSNLTTFNRLDNGKDNISLVKENELKINLNSYKPIKRNFGLDLLKIISMINILNLHLCVSTGLLYINPKTPKFKQIWRLEAFSYFPVDCFSLISGIVGYKRYKFSNLIYIWFIVCFYSFSTTLYFNYQQKIFLFNKSLLLSLFPILINTNWYLNAYFCMYLLLPFINAGINQLNQITYRNLVLFFLGFFSFYQVIASIFGNRNFTFLLKGYSSMWLTI